MNTNMSCADAEDLATHAAYVVPQVVCLFAGLLSVYLFSRAVISHGFKLVINHNAKMLMVLLTCFCLLFAVDLAVVAFMQLANVMFYQDPCSLLYKTSFCSPFRKVALTCFVGITSTQFCQMVERLVAAMSTNCSRVQARWLGRILILSSVVTAIMMIEWTLWSENANETITHCFTYSASPSIGPRMFILFKGILITDVVIILIFCALYIRMRPKQLTAQLSLKYEQKEHLAVLRTLSPMVLSNAFFVSVYILIAITVRHFREQLTLKAYKIFAINTFIFPYVSLLLSLTIFLTTKREYTRRKELLNQVTRSHDSNSSQYFKLYATQWSKAVPSRRSQQRQLFLSDTSEENC